MNKQSMRNIFTLEEKLKYFVKEGIYSELSPFFVFINEMNFDITSDIIEFIDLIDTQKNLEGMTLEMVKGLDKINNRPIMKIANCDNCHLITLDRDLFKLELHPHTIRLMLYLTRRTYFKRGLNYSPEGNLYILMELLKMNPDNHHLLDYTKSLFSKEDVKNYKKLLLERSLKKGNDNE